MDLEDLSELAAGLPGAVEDQPFGPDVDVFKVAGRMFAILSPQGPPGAISLKCDPLLATELRGRYAAVTPGYHLNKRHWNTVVIDGSVPDDELTEMVVHSYECVAAGLPKSVRDALTASQE